MHEAKERVRRFWPSLRLLAAAALCIGVLLAIDSDPFTPRTTAITCLLIGLLSVSLVVSSNSRGLWSASSVVALVALLFHLGALIPLAMGLPLRMGLFDFTWLLTTRASLTMWSAALAMATFASGVAIASVTTARTTRNTSQGSYDERRTMAAAGLVISGASIGTWFAIVLATLGPGFMLRSYEDYRSATDGYPMDLVFFGIGLGMVFIAAADVDTATKRQLWLFALWAAPALPLGLRGEVLFPLAAFIVIRARRHHIMHPLIAIALMVAILGGISAIKEVRQQGLADTQLSGVSTAPIEGLAEMGGTLVVLYNTIGWHENEGDPFDRGSTYVAPVDRLWNRVRGVANIPASADWRLMNVEIRARYGPIGGSMFAEAYHNFGVPGIALLPFGLGIGLTLFDRRRPTPIADAVLGVFLLAMLLHVRNSFTFVPIQIMMGLMAVGMLFIAARLMARPTEHVASLPRT